MSPLLVFLGLVIIWVVGFTIANQSVSERKLDRWFSRAPAHIREKITQLYRGSFCSANDYEEFFYMTDIKWKFMSYKEKLTSYQQYNLPPVKRTLNSYRYDSESYGCE